MAQQQQQSKLGTMKPMKVGQLGKKATGLKAAMKPIMGRPKPQGASLTLKSKSKMPTLSKVKSSLRKTMGYA